MQRTHKLVKETGDCVTWSCDALHTIRDWWTYKFLVHYEYDHSKSFTNSYYCKIISLNDQEVLADGIYFHMESLEDIMLYHVDEIKARRKGMTVEEYQQKYHQPYAWYGIPDDDYIPF